MVCPKLPIESMVRLLVCLSTDMGKPIASLCGAYLLVLAQRPDGDVSGKKSKGLRGNSVSHDGQWP